MNPRGARPSRRRSRITVGESPWPGVGEPAKSEEKKRGVQRRPSAAAAINRSDRAVAPAPAWTQFHRPRFFFPPSLPLPMSAAASIPKRTRGCRVWPSVESGEKKKRARAREGGGASDEGESERAEEIRHACYARALATCAMAVESVENESK